MLHLLNISFLNQFFFHVPFALLLTLLLFSHYYSLHVVAPCALLYLSCYHSSRVVAPIMLHILCCSLHAIVFMPILSHDNFAPLMMLLLHCSFYAVVMRYFLRTTTPLRLPLLSCYYSFHAFQLRANLTFVVFFVLSLLLLSHCWSFHVVTLFCLVSMVLPLPLPCVGWSLKLWH